MPLLTLSQVSLSFDGPKLLDEIDLNIEERERICILGRNGAGKSTLMKVVTGELEIDSGKITRAQGLSCASLTQEIPASLSGNLFDVVASGLGEKGVLLSRYMRVHNEVDKDPSAKNLEKLERVQNEIETHQSWEKLKEIETVLSKMSLEPGLEFTTCSAGLKRRTLLARAIVAAPDVLLMDEPTNHLDISAIMWMEDFLTRMDTSLLFVTHDRKFLQNVSTRIVELDRGRLHNYPCDYSTYLDRRKQFLEQEDKENRLFDKRLGEEETWIRQGIKARRTRNEGRVRALEKMRVERQQRRKLPGNARIFVDVGEKSGQLVCKVVNLCFAYDEQTPIVHKFTANVYRGDRIALIGPNGIGKSTFLKLILGELKADSGTVKLGTHLNIAYFDQLHNQLDESVSAFENIGEGSEHIQVGGGTRHVLGHLKNFLFTPDRARGPIDKLSGGEKNRLLLAKLFARPANVLVLDEPTNDLDMETLDLLEELLMNYEGTVFLVSHDREFINRIATTSFAFEGDGIVGEYVGGYDDWERQSHFEAKPVAQEEKTQGPPVTGLSKTEKNELGKLPKRIEAIEAKQALLHEKMAEPGFYDQDKSKVDEVVQELKALNKECDAAYARWEELESKN